MRDWKEQLKGIRPQVNRDERRRDIHRSARPSGTAQGSVDGADAAEPLISREAEGKERAGRRRGSTRRYSDVQVSPLKKRGRSKNESKRAATPKADGERQGMQEYVRGLDDIYGGRGRRSAAAARPASPAHRPSSLDSTEEADTSTATIHLDVAGVDEHCLLEGWRTCRPGAVSVRRRRIVIGVDFGTAYTKAVIQVDGLLTRAVVFRPQVDGVGRFLLPGAFRRGEADLCALVDGPALYTSNLKLPLVYGAPDRSDHEACALVFLALVLRYARGWVLKELAAELGSDSPDWQLNVGLPTKTWSTNSLHQDYRRVVRLAWILSVQEAPIRFADALELQAEDEESGALLERHERGLPADVVNVAPEFAAQVAGYIRSPRRRSDLHLFVDVGAGTLDVTTFNVHEDKSRGDVLPVFATSVLPLGTHFLMKKRFAVSPNAVWHDLDPVLSPAALATRAGIAIESVDAADREVGNRVGETVWRLLRHTRCHRYSKSPAWTSEFPVILAGGGSTLGAYRAFVARCPPSIPLVEMPLPIPKGIADVTLSADEYGRLCVAHGLSYSIDDLGELRPESDVPDEGSSASAGSYRDRFVDKDQT